MICAEHRVHLVATVHQANVELPAEKGETWTAPCLALSWSCPVDDCDHSYWPNENQIDYWCEAWQEQQAMGEQIDRRKNEEGSTDGTTIQKNHSQR